MADETQSARELLRQHGLEAPDEQDNAIAALIVEARTNFLAYILLFNPPASGFCLSRLHAYLAGIVQGVVDGTRAKRQAISVPPQHGKSKTMSWEAASWIMGRRPGIEVAITSFSADLVGDASRFIRSRVESPLYQLVFPNSAPVFGSNRVDNWRMENGSGLKSKPAGSKLTGRRVDWLIVDDAHAGREEAESPVMRNKVITWYYADCVSRLSPGAAIFVVGTRWHKNDLIGAITDPEKVAELEAGQAHDQVFEVTNMPALCSEPDTDPLARAEGEALFPERRDRRFLEGIRLNIPSYEWDSQFCGRPRSAGMGQADTNLITRIRLEQVPEHLEIVRGWDFALTEKQQSDYTAGALCAYDAQRDHFYIIDAMRNQRTWVKNRRWVLAQADLDKEDLNVQRMGVEGVAGFLAVYQDLRAALAGELRVEVRNPPRGGKLARATPWINKIEMRRVFMVIGNWNAEFISELEEFPNAEHDDQVDAVSICWEMLTGRNRNGTMLDEEGNTVVAPNTGRPAGVNRPSGVPRN